MILMLPLTLPGDSKYMIPYSFDIESCAEICGDALVRTLGNEARKFAAAGHAPRTIWPHTVIKSMTYWQQVQSVAKQVVWLDAYRKRIARLKRMQK